jgi:hypothetical protein
MSTPKQASRPGSKSPRVPSYREHKPSGQARVIIQGKHFYLGEYGTPESWEMYQRLVAERLGIQAPVMPIGSSVADRRGLRTRRLMRPVLLQQPLARIPALDGQR